MYLWEILEFCLVVLIILFFVTQVFTPAMKGKPLFQMFRRKRVPDLTPEARLARAEEAVRRARLDLERAQTDASLDKKALREKLRWAEELEREAKRQLKRIPE